MSRIHLRVGAWAIAFALTVSACGSGTDDDGGEAPKREVKSMTYVTDFIMNGEFAPVFLAKEKGWYEEEGIDLNIVFGTGSAATAQQVSSGQAEFGDVFSGVAVSAIAEGAEIVSIGTAREDAAFAFFCDEKLNVNSFEDLRGHSVIVPPGTAQARLLPAVMSAIEVPEDAIDVQAVEPKTAGSVYATGRSDCIVAITADSPTFQKERPSSVLLWSDSAFNIPGFVYIVKSELAESDPERVAGFLRATYRGVAATLEDEEPAIEAFMRANPTANEELVRAQWDVTVDVTCTDASRESGAAIGYQDPDSWAAGMQIMYQYQEVPESIKVEDVFTNEFFDEHAVSDSTCSDEG